MPITISGGSHVDPTSAGGGGISYDYTVKSYGPYRSYKPVAKAGVPAGTQLAVQTGNSSRDFVVTAGGWYDAVDFQCRVIIKTASPVRFTRCRFGGRAVLPNGATGLIDCNQNPGSNYNVTVYDSTLASATPSIWQNGVVGHDFVLERCDIFNVTDGVQAGSTLSGGVNANVTLRGCWVHDLSFFSPDTTSGTTERSGTHNDCVQWMGGAGFTTEGNFFDGHMNPSVGAAQFDQAHRDPVIGGGPNNPFAVASDAYGYSANYPNLATNSCFQFTAGTAPLSGWSSTGDWFGGGGYAVNISGAVGGACTGARFARTFLYGPIAAPSPGASVTVTTDFTGCVYEDDGKQAKIYNGATGTTTLAPVGP